MRPGRLPENHPLEQLARAKLRGLSPEAQRAQQEQQQSTPQPPQPAPRRAAPRRWT